MYGPNHAGAPTCFLSPNNEPLVGLYILHSIHNITTAGKKGPHIVPTQNLKRVLDHPTSLSFSCLCSPALGETKPSRMTMFFGCFRFCGPLVHLVLRFRKGLGLRALAGFGGYFESVLPAVLTHRGSLGLDNSSCSTVLGMSVLIHTYTYIHIYICTVNTGYLDLYGRIPPALQFWRKSP